MALNPIQQRELRIPFGVDATGGIAFTATAPEIFAHRVVSIVGTAVGERPMRAGYGTDASGYAFEIIDEVTTDSLAANVREAVRVWEPGVNVVEVRTTEDPLNGTIVIEVLFSIVETADVAADTEQIYTASISVAGTVSEL